METCILGVKLRENAERPETVDVGVNMVTGANYGEMLRGTEQMLNIVPSS